MKRTKLAITFVPAAGFAVSCNRAGTPSQQLDQPKNAAESTWQDVKAGSNNKAFNRLNDGFPQAGQWVSDNAAP